jgi:hypothetical protein
MLDYSKPKEYDKPHKFFEKILDNDLDKLEHYLTNIYKLIESQQLNGTTKLDPTRDSFVDSKSISTIKWREYNIFQFNEPQIWNIYSGIADVVKEACDYYGIDFKEQKYMVQGWFNINYASEGKLNWHDHGGPWAPHFHGYYSIKAEPSSTYYKLYNDENQIVENKNINNRLIISEMGHPHAQGDWSWEGPRITLAYDIIPMKYLPAYNFDQHFVPLV